MATEVVMPKLGATMEEGTIVSWLVQVGEEVEEGDPIVEIQTDKIVMEIEAERTGILLKTFHDEHAVVKVHDVIAYLGDEGENIEGLDKQPSNESAPVKNETETLASGEGNDLKTPATASGDKIRRTPAARKLAEEHQLDLGAILGTGPLGRIYKADVEKYLENNTKKITPLAKKIAENEGIDYSQLEGSGLNGKIVKDDIVSPRPSAEAEKETVVSPSQDKRVPLKGIRKVVADRMSQSAYTAPHVTLTSEIDMTNCVNVRQELLPAIEKMNGHRLSFNEIIVKATAQTLRNHPEINISLQDQEIIYHSAINVGFAVAVPNGLVVPVVKGADKMGLAQITEECKTLGGLAREGKLLPEQMQGGTFTISNLGMYAVDGFSPIINQPEAAILGVGRIVEKPVAYNGEIALRSMMVLSLSFDHRIIDGAPAAAFLTELKEILEHPLKLMI
ncbi:dihydrolipoamide acetyltransferase family protein [Anaerobacillus sp. MEB173]|uniref:dihydrolipoamide acetyltransferase family protein n=1 Tax=Anaerobacillus sp. MEB173 TaxID=3383345 RepID=UPI003F8DA1D6